MCKIYVKFDIHPEDFLADLTYAVYQVVLKAGLSVPFISMELDLQSALRETIRKKMLVSDETENSASRLFKEAEPWSLDAKTIFETLKTRHPPFPEAKAAPYKTPIGAFINSFQSLNE